MKVNLDVILTDLKGNEVKQNDEFIFLSSLCVNALLSGEGKEDKLKCFKLATIINASPACVEMTVEDASFLKSILNNSNYTPLVIGRVFEILEG